jgi:hypothetical protein
MEVHIYNTSHEGDCRWEEFNPSLALVKSMTANLKNKEKEKD